MAKNKFYYGDRVRVIDGFYKGNLAIVIEYDPKVKKYLCQIHSIMHNRLYESEAWIEESFLEEVEGDW